MNEYKNRFFEKSSLDPSLILKKKIRGLQGINLGQLVQAILDTDGTLEEVSVVLGYTKNPVKEAIRSSISKVFPERSRDFGLGVATRSWKLEILDYIGVRSCQICKEISPHINFTRDTSRHTELSYVCKSCNLLKSKRHKMYIAERTPSWSELDEIAKFYRNCPEGYEVDHIIPLRGTFISGLHVLSNLQYLTIKDNRAKSNKYSAIGEAG